MDHLRVIDPKAYADLLHGNKIRCDGRELDEFRELLITPDLVESVSGSSTIKMGNTAIICGINAAVTRRRANGKFPQLLTVITKVAPYAASRFNLGNSFRARQSLVDVGAAISQHIEKILHAGQCLPAEESLWICEELAWKLTVNILCVDHSGNLLDAALIATITALKNTRLPVVDYDPATGEWSTPEDSEPLPLRLKHDVIACSFALICSGSSGGIDGVDRIFPDPGIEEEDISQGTLTVALDPDDDGTLVYLFKSDGGPVTDQLMSKCITACRSRVSRVIYLINEAVKRYNELRTRTVDNDKQMELN